LLKKILSFLKGLPNVGICRGKLCILLKFFIVLSITATDKRIRGEIDMTIESITGRTHPPLTIKANQKAGIDSEKNASVKSAEKNDSIAITAMAQGIKKAFESSFSATLVDVERVAAVNKALADGTYQVNSERIAEKMIQYEKLMSQDKRT
jgi:negative regulator of flagellin synthesis FlgM